jgi:hypothetical protein
MALRAITLSPANHFGCIETTAVLCCSRICSASFAIVCTTACAEPIVVTSAALSPAARHISSKSPVVSGVGRMAANFGIKYSRPPSSVLPMVCGGSGCGGVFASCLPTHVLPGCVSRASEHSATRDRKCKSSQYPPL